MDTDKKPIADKELRCGVVPVRFAWGDWQLLLLRSGNLWDFPAGVASIHEDLLEAAKRETLAATALTDLEFAFGEDGKETVPYAGNKVDRYYVALAALKALADDGALNASEVSRAIKLYEINPDKPNPVTV